MVWGREGGGGGGWWGAVGAVRAEGLGTPLNTSKTLARAARRWG